MAILERDVVLQGRESGQNTIDLPITALRNIEDTAETKSTPANTDYLPLIDAADSGQMKKMLWSSLKTSAQQGLVPTSRTINGHALSGNVTLTAADTSSIPTTARAAVNGVASLDAAGHLPLSQVPTEASNRPVRCIVGTSTAGWTARDCDILCNGTNDQTKILSALNSLPATGGEILLLTGTYQISTALVIDKDNVTLTGSGPSTILLRGWNSTDMNGVIEVSGSHCVIRNLTVNGNCATHTSGKNIGIYLKQTQSCSVTETICTANAQGIYASTGADSFFANNTCSGNTAFGIYVVSLSRSVISGNVCSQNNTGQSASGIYVGSACNGLTLIGNSCVENDSCGIYIGSATKSSITGNTCSSNGADGMKVAGNENTITGNMCSYNQANGINLTSARNNITVSGNTCNHNTSNGIYLSGRNNYIAVSSNSCGSNSIGISASSAKYCTISSNTCSQNQTGIKLSSTTFVTVSANLCFGNDIGIALSSTSNGSVTGNVCARGSGVAGDYSDTQYTIQITGGSKNVISSNNLLGKNYSNSGTDNVFDNNTY